MLYGYVEILGIRFKAAITLTVFCRGFAAVIVLESVVIGSNVPAFIGVIEILADYSIIFYIKSFFSILNEACFEPSLFRLAVKNFVLLVIEYFYCLQASFSI